MSDRIYRKTGHTLRAEFSHGTLALIKVSERGLAIEQNSLFTSRHEPSEISVDAPGETGLRKIADDFRSDPAVERFTILCGNADHSIEGGNQWSESFGRIHLSMVNQEQQVRVLLDLGGQSLDGIDMALIERVRVALRQPLLSAPARIQSIRLLPHVAAALWAAVDSVAKQSTHPGFRFDGDGKEIQPARSAPWPNRFRPSYRVRPAPLPFHLRVPPRGEDSPAEVTAIGVADPFRKLGNTVTAMLLCTTTRDVFVAPLILEENFEERIRFVSDQMTWFPFRAGAWGSETVLEGIGTPR